MSDVWTVSHTYLPAAAFYRQEDSWYSFPSEAEQTPKPKWQLEGLLGQ
jgi:hypothetical protein